MTRIWSTDWPKVWWNTLTKKWFHQKVKTIAHHNVWPFSPNWQLRLLTKESKLFFVKNGSSKKRITTNSTKGPALAYKYSTQTTLSHPNLAHHTPSSCWQQKRAIIMISTTACELFKKVNKSKKHTKVLIHIVHYKVSEKEPSIGNNENKEDDWIKSMDWDPLFTDDWSQHWNGSSIELQCWDLLPK